ncbi:MAG: SOS response-associated peptidase family protein [Nitrosomonas sp.]|nr:SOS response-associated peptidase family protein [Nitrosomonas sp.]
MRFEDSPLSFAGLWETATVDEVTIDSCTIITTESNTVMRSLHDRIPVILPPEVWDTWLTPTQQPDAILLSLLQFYSAEQLQLWAVSPAVGRASNEGEQLIQPIHD